MNDSANKIMSVGPIITFVMFATILLSTPKTAISDTFFWEDKKGIHVVDDPSSLPPRFFEKYQKWIKGSSAEFVGKGGSCG